MRRVKKTVKKASRKTTKKATKRAVKKATKKVAKKAVKKAGPDKLLATLKMTYRGGEYSSGDRMTCASGTLDFMRMLFPDFPRGVTPQQIIVQVHSNPGEGRLAVNVRKNPGEGSGYISAANVAADDTGNLWRVWPVFRHLAGQKVYVSYQTEITSSQVNNWNDLVQAIAKLPEETRRRQVRFTEDPADYDSKLLTRLTRLSFAEGDLVAGDAYLS